MVGQGRDGDRYRAEHRGGTTFGGKEGVSPGGAVLVVIQQLFTANGSARGRAAAGVPADEIVHAVPEIASLGQQALAVQSVQVSGRFP